MHHRPMPSPEIEMWFDFASPYSYLAARRVEAVAEGAGARVVYRPFLLGPIFQDLFGSSDSPFNRNPARGRHMWSDVEREAKKLGVPVRRVTDFPRGSLLATRVALVVESEPYGPAFVRGIFERSFVDDADIASEAVVRSVLAPLSPAADEILARAVAPETKARLRARSEEARARGIFGAPSFFVNGDLYWGNDRLEAAISAIGPAKSTFVGTPVDYAKTFAERWLPAWTGNDPERLAAFYTDDATYLDPVVPAGVTGKEALLAYFRKLLVRNPAWVWTQRGSVPMEGGFCNLWHASIPGVGGTREVDGVCLVHLRGDRIARNEVYFDRSLLFATKETSADGR